MSKTFTTPEEIRAELSKLGYAAHGKKCMVVLNDPKNAPIEAIIHCKDVPEDMIMRWYFCQDEYIDIGMHSGNQHGKEYAWSFADNEENDYVYSLQWIEETEEDKKTKPTLTVLTPKVYGYDGAELSEDGITIDFVKKTVEEWKEHANKIRRVVAKHSKLTF
jgi:hypothetical protein